jgi:hypothetical protein
MAANAKRRTPSNRGSNVHGVEGVEGDESDESVENGSPDWAATSVALVIVEQVNRNIERDEPKTTQSP